MYKKILCVCLCNTCRSPLAKQVLSAKLAQAGLDVEVDSAALWSRHAGQPADSRAAVAARLRGYDLSGHIVRKFAAQDYRMFDAILAMDSTVRDEIELKRPYGNTTPVQLFTNCADSLRGQNVPNPYYTGKFDPVLDMLEKSSDECIAELYGVRQLARA